MNDYRERCIEKTIKKNLDVFGAILLVGPKWCGKTTTAKLFCNSSIEFANPVDSRYYINMADVDIMLLLKGKKPRLFDEWQILPYGMQSVMISMPMTCKERIFLQDPIL